MPSGNDYLTKTGRPWAKWVRVGDTVTGRVLEEPSVRQSRDYESGEMLEWPNGDPKLEVLVPIETGQNDPDIPNDNGERAVVMPLGSNRFRAVQQAMRDAKADGIYPGDTLAITYVGDGPKQKGRIPVKEFKAILQRGKKSGKITAAEALKNLGVSVVREEEEPPF